MTLLLGYLIVFISMIGGFMLAGGHPAVLLHISEFIIIGGIGVGIIVVASPTKVMKDLFGQLRSAFRGSGVKKEQYVELFKALYEIFMLARRDGMVALEEHVIDPANSTILQKYPSVLSDKVALQFL